jgi:glucokinase
VSGDTAPRAVMGIDVGGTAIKARVLGADGLPRMLPSVATPRGDASGAATTEAIARLVEDAGDVGAVGLATPGIVDDAAGVCRMSVNLGWRDVPIRDLVAARTGLPVLLTHDVRAGARGEWAARAAAGRSDGLLFVPLGTGLAVAQVDASGTPLGTGWAGEVGQVRWTSGPFNGLRYEEVVSAGGLATRYGAADARTVLDAVHAGEPRAVRMWEETVEALADLLAWAVALTAPATIVLGGGLAQAGDVLLDPLRSTLARRLAGFPEPSVERSVLGVDAAAVGLADLARRLLDAPPMRDLGEDTGTIGP